MVLFVVQSLVFFIFCRESCAFRLTDKWSCHETKNIKLHFFLLGYFSPSRGSTELVIYNTQFIISLGLEVSPVDFFLPSVLRRTSGKDTHTHAHRHTVTKQTVTQNYTLILQPAGQTTPPLGKSEG